MKRNIHILVCALLVMWCAVVHGRADVWINEIHYDNVATDTNEGVEVAGTAGTDLSSYSLHFYNGNNGLVYIVKPLTGAVPAETNGFGAIWFSVPGLQNGSPDGVALAHTSGGVTTAVQFLSYEGTFATTQGPAKGLTSTDVGESESSTQTVGWALQLYGSGTNDSAFAWNNRPHSRGLVNPDQFFVVSDLPLLIVSQPADQAVFPGATARFAVVASGPMPFAYQWRRNGQDLAGETNRILSIANTQVADCGEYSVAVANSSDLVLSRRATLSVWMHGLLQYQDGVASLVSGQLVRIAAPADNVIRVRVEPAGQTNAINSIIIDSDATGHTAWYVTNNPDGYALLTDRLRVVLDTNTAAVQIQKRSRMPIIEADAGELTPTNIDGSAAYALRQSFRLDPDEVLWGLGQNAAGLLNLRGTETHLVQENTTAVTPFLLSSAGYAILWDNASESWVGSDASNLLWRSAVGDAIDYYVIYGPGIDDVVRSYRDLTGAAPLFPRWTYGYIQSKNWYSNRNDLVSTVQEYRDRNLPLDCIVQDAGYWGRNPDDRTMGFVMDTNLFPDAAGMIDLLHTNYHCRYMVSIWPFAGTSTPMHVDMKDHDAFFRIRPDLHQINLFDPYGASARQRHWSWLNAGLFTNGVDAWWMDATEPELSWSEQQDGETAAGANRRFINSYSMMAAKGVHDGQRSTSGEKRVFILSRSAFAGQQRYAAATWSGDIAGTWEELRRQISGGLGFCMSGLPYWTSDIGGYYVPYVGGATNVEYRNLYTRWFQFGAFCPLFRSHGQDTPREIWRFGEPGSPHYDALRRFSRLRSRLLAYIYSTAWQITAAGSTMCRALPFDFAADDQVQGIGDEYMFGPAMLVCPLSGPTGDLFRIAGGAELFTTSGVPGGLDGAYFNGVNFQQFVTSRVDSDMDMSWPGSPAAGVNANNFSVRWTGSFLATNSGPYRFRTLSDDGVRLWVNSNLVVDNWTMHPAAYDYGTAVLSSGTLYNVKLEMFEGTVVGRIQLAYRITTNEFDTDLTARSCYLPRGYTWFDFWTGNEILGGQVLFREPPLDEIPLFVRGGSIVPMGPALEYADLVTNAPLEIRVYPGGDAQFVLYEDAGNSYDYESGQYSVITMRWDNASQTLKFDARQGTFPGLQEERDFNVVLVGPGMGDGPDEESNNVQVVQYDGTPCSVAFSQAGCTILAPRNFGEILDSEPFVGAGVGPGDSLSNLVWISDRQGYLGAGPSLVCPPLAVGTHHVILAATNEQGVTASASVMIEVLGDSNTNTLPDDWEAHFWPEFDSGGATNDFDQDGIANADEWLAGTDPTNEDSGLALFGTESDGWFNLFWPGTSNRIYQLEGTTNLLDGFQVMGSPLSGPPAVVPPSAPQGFYRIKASR